MVSACSYPWRTSCSRQQSPATIREEEAGAGQKDEAARGEEERREGCPDDASKWRAGS